MIKIIFKTTKITKPLKKYKMYWQSALPNKKPRAASVSMVIKLKTSLDKIPFKKLGICKLVRTVMQAFKLSKERWKNFFSCSLCGRDAFY